MKIAFIGLGNMGGPMALNLLKAGHEIQAFDLSKPACDKLAADGVAIAASATAAVQGAEAIITMLPASQHVEALFLGSNGQPGLLAHIAKGALVIDSSTIAAATSQKVAQAAQAQGVDFIDAPVSGGTGGAIAGTLTFMVGGSTAQLANGTPVAIVPMQAEMTTNQAADILNVSRPFVIQLLESEQIPFRLVGTHRRIRYEDLMRFKRKDDAKRRTVADELAAESRKLGFEY